MKIDIYLVFIFLSYINCKELTDLQSNGISANINVTQLDLFLSKSMLSAKKNTYISLYLSNQYNDNIEVEKCKLNMCSISVNDVINIIYSSKQSFMIPNSIIDVIKKLNQSGYYLFVYHPYYLLSNIPISTKVYNDIIDDENLNGIVYKSGNYFQCNLFNQIYTVCVKIDIPSLFEHSNKFIITQEKMIITNNVEIIKKLKIDEKSRIMKEKMIIIEENEDGEESDNNIIIRIPSYNITINCDYSNIYPLQYCRIINHYNKHTKSLPVCSHNDYSPHVQDCDSSSNNHLIYFTYDNTSCESINPPNESYIKCHILPSNSTISIIEIAFYSIVILTTIMVTLSLTIFRRFTNTTFNGKLYIALVYIASIIMVLLSNIIFQFIDINKDMCYYITCFDQIFLLIAIFSMESMTFYIREEEVENKVIVNKDFLVYFLRYVVVIIIESMVVFIFKEKELLVDKYNISDYIITIEYCSNTKEELLLFNFLSLYCSLHALFNSCRLIFFADLTYRSRYIMKGVCSFTFCYIIIRCIEINYTPFVDGQIKVIFSLCYLIIIEISLLLLLDYRCGKKNVNPYLKRTDLYQKLLREPIMRAYFKILIKDNNQESYMSFYICCLHYRTKSPNLTEDVKIQTAKEIFNIYLDPTSTNQVKISDGKRKQIISKMSKNVFDSTLYASAELEIAEYLTSQYANTFLKSTYCEKAKTLANWYSTFEKLTDDLKEAIKEKIEDYFISKREAKYQSLVGIDLSESDDTNSVAVHTPSTPSGTPPLNYRESYRRSNVPVVVTIPENNKKMRSSSYQCSQASFRCNTITPVYVQQVSSKNRESIDSRIKKNTSSYHNRSNSNVILNATPPNNDNRSCNKTSSQLNLRIRTNSSFKPMKNVISANPSLASPDDNIKRLHFTNPSSPEEINPVAFSSDTASDMTKATLSCKD